MRYPLCQREWRLIYVLFRASLRLPVCLRNAALVQRRYAIVARVSPKSAKIKQGTKSVMLHLYFRDIAKAGHFGILHSSWRDSIRFTFALIGAVALAAITIALGQQSLFSKTSSFWRTVSA